MPHEADPDAFELWEGEVIQCPREQCSGQLEEVEIEELPSHNLLPEDHDWEEIEYRYRASFWCPACGALISMSKTQVQGEVIRTEVGDIEIPQHKVTPDRE